MKTKNKPKPVTKPAPKTKSLAKKKGKKVIGYKPGSDLADSIQ
jgi:hypothetical protein